MKMLTFFARYDNFHNDDGENNNKTSISNLVF